MTNPTLRLTLPIPPSVNHSTRRHTVCYQKGGKQVRRTMDVPNAKAVKWMATAKDSALDAMNSTGWVCAQSEKVVVEVEFYWENRRKRDCHNCTGIIANILEGIAADDDYWMLLRVKDWHIDRGNPRVEVTCRRKD